MSTVVTFPGIGRLCLYIILLLLFCFSVPITKLLLILLIWLVRKLYLFVEGGNPNLKQVRREYLFVELLESIDPSEAELLLQVKDKKIKCRGLTYNLVKETFPELISWNQLSPLRIE